MASKDTRHVLNVGQFDRPLSEQLFARADQLKHKRTGRELADKVLSTMFYEPSTRTRLSFESAATKLGMGVVSTENAKASSSDRKGESLEDTIRMLNAFEFDAIVIRHPEVGTADRAAAVSEVPVINGGDGGAEHPTQAIYDAYTMQSELSGIDGKTVVMGSDLAHSRTCRSFAKILANFNDIRILFVSPPEVPIGDDIKQFLKERSVAFSESTDLSEVLPQADVVYWNRLQQERFEDTTLFEKLKGSYVIGTEQMKLMKPGAILLNPLPRVDEIDPAVDDDPRAAYFRQANNGLYIRMALLEWVLGGAPSS